MALQLTPMMGTTAFPDRMGDYHPNSLNASRIAQGYNVSGTMTHKTMTAVNRDLADLQWRNLFQKSILHDSRFQRGLFANPPEGTLKHTESDKDPEWLQFHSKNWATESLDVEAVQSLSRRRLHGGDATRFEYGWALIKTAASLIYTIQLCQELHLTAVTDSQAHHGLLTQTCQRESMTLENICIKREGY